MAHQRQFSVSILAVILMITLMPVLGASDVEKSGDQVEKGTTFQVCGCRIADDGPNGELRGYFCGCKVMEFGVGDLVLISAAMLGLGALSVKFK